jgi:hypothetical protein
MSEPSEHALIARFPAKAGTYLSAFPGLEPWTPAFAPGSGLEQHKLSFRRNLIPL